MDADKDILKRLGRKDGMTVPDGYFADFAARMSASLPVTPYEESATEPIVAPKRTLWQRVRPYAYMAAMFAGVWCMLKMFTMFTSKPESFEISPVLAEAINNDAFFKEYVVDNIDETMLYDDLYDENFDISCLYDISDVANPEFDAYSIQ